MSPCIIYKEEDSYFISWDANGFPGAPSAAGLSWTDITRLLDFVCVSIEIGGVLGMRRMGGPLFDVITGCLGAFKASDVPGTGA